MFVSFAFELVVKLRAGITSRSGDVGEKSRQRLEYSIFQLETRNEVIKGLK